MDRKDLLDALRMAKPALSSQDFIPVLKHFVFDGQTVSAYNDNLGIQIEFPSELQCAIPGDLLQSLVSKYSADELKFDFGKDKVEIKCGRNRTSLPFLDPVDDKDQFIEWMPEEGSAVATFKADGPFLVGLGRCKEFVGNDGNKLAEIGITMTTEGPSGHLYSTDNLTISSQKLSLHSYEGADLNIIIPVPWCLAVNNLTNEIGDEDVQIEIGDGYIMADISGEAVVVAKLIEAEPYAFKEIIEENLGDSDYEKLLVTPPDEFYAALDRNLVIQGKSMEKEIDVTIADSVMAINCNSDLGNSDDTIEFDGKLDDVSFQCDPVLLMKAGKICSKLAFLDNVIIGREGSFIHIISHTAEA